VDKVKGRGWLGPIKYPSFFIYICFKEFVESLAMVTYWGARVHLKASLPGIC
jgi:hypothetical protein